MAIVLVACLLLGGCATKPPVVVDPLGAAPQDFSLDVTVMTGRDVDDVQKAKLLCGRYVLEADGSLHQGVAESASWGARWLPERTRTLSREQVAQVWSLTQQMGFVDPVRGNENINLYLIDPSPGDVTYLLATTANDNRMTYVQSKGIGEPGDPAVTRLVEMLAELSWTSPTPQAQGYEIPMRYEFGPDPYARYRQPEAK